MKKFNYWPEVKFGCALFFSLFFVAFCNWTAEAQPPVQEFDHRIVASDFFKDEWGDNYGICEVPRLTAVTDVTGPFIGGQCLKRNPGNTAWVGGTCGGGGQGGFDFDSASADPQHNWIFPLGVKPLTASINFTTAACPSGWGTNCWSAEPQAIVGSYTGVNNGAPPSDIVLLSNTRIAYASATDKRATSVWVGTTQYKVEFIAHNGTLGVREVVYSTLQTPLPGTNWQNVRFEFSDGSFAPATEGSLVQRTADKEELIGYLGLTQFVPNEANIYPVVKDILTAGTNVEIDPSDANNSITINSIATGGSGSSSEEDGRFIALETTPTDLTDYANGQVLRVNTPAPGKWLEVQGADSDERHSFRTEFEADSANPAQASWTVGTDLNYGYSSFGDVFGELYTADGGKAFTPTNTPVMRMEIEQEVATVTPNVGGNIYGFTTTYTLLIRKTDLESAPSAIYARYYTGPPGSGNQVTTVEFMKGTDNAMHDYHTYIDRSGADINTAEILSIKYFNLFTSNPATGDQTSNPLQLHDAKSLTEIDAYTPPETGTTIKNKLSNLTGPQRLSALSLKDLQAASLPNYVHDVLESTQVLVTPPTGTFSATNSIIQTSKEEEASTWIRLSKTHFVVFSYHDIDTTRENRTAEVYFVILNDDLTSVVSISNAFPTSYNAANVSFYGWEGTNLIFAAPPPTRYSPLSLRKMTIDSYIRAPTFTNFTGFTTLQSGSLGGYGIRVSLSPTKILVGNVGNNQNTFDKVYVYTFNTQTNVVSRTELTTTSITAITDVVIHNNISITLIPINENLFFSPYQRVLNTTTNQWTLDNRAFIYRISGSNLTRTQVTYPNNIDFTGSTFSHITRKSATEFYLRPWLGSSATNSTLYEITFSSDYTSMGAEIIQSDNAFADFPLGGSYYGYQSPNAENFVRLVNNTTRDRLDISVTKYNYPDTPGVFETKGSLKAGSINNLVPQQFRSDATTSTTRFQPKCFEAGTTAQITALTKVENCIYLTYKTSQ